MHVFKEVRPCWRGAFGIGLHHYFKGPFGRVSPPFFVSPTNGATLEWFQHLNREEVTK
jgi:hypothetical protein